MNKLLRESHRIVHIGDREADIYDLFHLAQADGSQFLVGIKVNRNCIVAWRFFWMTMINREGTTLPAELVLSETEIKILDHLKPDSKQTKKSLSTYLTKIAKLGGYLARSSDPPPGNNVMWRGIQRLNEIQIGVEIGMKLVGN